MEALLNFLVLLGVLLLIGTCVRLWLRAFRAIETGKPILPPLVPLPWVRWGLVDLGLLMLLIVGLQLAAASFLSRFPEPEQVIQLDKLREERAEKSDEQRDTPDESHGAEGIERELDAGELSDVVPGSMPTDRGQQQRLLGSMIIANLAWVVLGLLLLRYVRGISFSELGIDPRRFGEDVRLGLSAFCMLAPPVYLLQLGLVQVWPSEHPLVDMIREDSTGQLFWMGAVAAVLVAPLFEELAFRLFLQGWLENLVRVVDQEPLPEEMAISSEPADPYWQMLLQGWTPRKRASESNRELPSSDGGGDRLDRSSLERDDRRLLTGESPEKVNPWASPEGLGPRPPSPGPQGQLLRTPILISSLIFALLHYSHGPDWIPLLLLAVGLGYLYQRTRRILPCILVHFFLNLTSFAMLVLDMTLRP